MIPERHASMPKVINPEKRGRTVIVPNDQPDKAFNQKRRIQEDGHTMIDTLMTTQDSNKKLELM